MARKKIHARSTGNGRKKTVKKLSASKKTTTTTSISVRDPLTKGGIIKAITDITALPKRDVVASLEALTKIIELHVKARGPGKFVMPGLLKINVVKKAARPARKGINPFTGEEVMFKAKPAHKVVKIRPLKRLKEMTE